MPGQPESVVPPLLSVVITIVDGGEALRRCLGALQAQAETVQMETLVPFDSSVEDLTPHRLAFPDVTFLDMGVVPTIHPPPSAAGQHELYDRRRAAGLAAARGQLVAILEDRAAPAPGWALAAVRLHGQHSVGVIGGAVEPVDSSLLNWAFWVCDFARYALPFSAGPARWVSDVNVTYKREVLDQVRELWDERFQEPKVHWALLSRGETLYLSPALVVYHQQPPLRLGPLLPQRFQWGRLFGAVRARHSDRMTRLGLILLSPAIPCLLLARQARILRRRRNSIRFIRALPALLVLLTAWALGEAWGLLTGQE
jgi:hypothetical protein